MKSKWIVITMGLLFCLLTLVYLTSAEAMAKIQSSCSGLKCDGTDACYKDEEPPFQITVPEGSIVTSLWLKAGQNCFYFDQNGNNGCYQIEGIGTRTAEASKAGGGPDCQDISNIETASKPTAVELIMFEGATKGCTVSLSWETASELDILGFNLYRASLSGIEDLKEKINNNLIPAQNPGNQVGGLYDWLDDGATPGVNFYWLEKLDAIGAITLYGPVSATLPYCVFLPKIGKTGGIIGDPEPPILPPH